MWSTEEGPRPSGPAWPAQLLQSQCDDNVYLEVILSFRDSPGESHKGDTMVFSLQMPSQPSSTEKPEVVRRRSKASDRGLPEASHGRTIQKQALQGIPLMGKGGHSVQGSELGVWGEMWLISCRHRMSRTLPHMAGDCKREAQGPWCFLGPDLSTDKTRWIKGRF